MLREGTGRELIQYFNSCVKCGLCFNACHMYYSTHTLEYAPAFRMELLKRIYKKYFTLSGKLIPWISKASNINPKSLNQLRKAVFECTGCRRCSFYCPIGIDPTLPITLSRGLLSKIDLAPEILKQLADMQIERAKTVDLYRDIIIEQINELKAKLRNDLKDPKADIPINKVNANILYVPISSEESILSAAKIFNVVGENWSLSIYDAPNWAFFLGDIERAKAISNRIIDEALKLKVETVVIAECGHGHFVMKNLISKWFNRVFPFKVKNIVEVLAEYIADNRINTSKISRKVTYHDPCRLARNCGIIEEPRYVINKIAEQFIEMKPNKSRNWCCGGGGGLVAVPEFENVRILTGAVKAKQINETKAEIVVAPCENCKQQITSIKEKYNLNVEVMGLVDLVNIALHPNQHSKYFIH
jgi:Fe-S oxidoreductase